MAVSAASIVIGVLLAAGVGIELLSCLGLLLMRSAYDRLHFVAPAAALGPVLIVAAVLVQHSSAQACIKGLLIVAALLLINPVLTHATARAARIRETGRLDAQDDSRRVRPKHI
jgi:multicomponent Na+:H+ antiporter subunit G